MLLLELMTQYNLNTIFFVYVLQLQQESAGQSEFVRQYLEQQQRNLERQMEVKKQVEGMALLQLR